jgi:integrase
MIADGVDPTAERKAIRKDATLSDMWERWLAEHAKPRLRQRTIDTDVSRWETCFSDWRNRRIRSITSADVRRKLIELGNSRGRTSANRGVQLLRRLMTFARVSPNPCGRGEVEFFRESPRERYLTGAEMGKLLASIDAEPNTTVADFCRVAMWTGQRRGNVASMRWAEVDMASGVWAIPSSKFKTGKTLAIPLAKPALDVLVRRQGNGSEYVFPGRDGGHLMEPKAGWKRIHTRAGLSNVHLHDLRHNVASWAVGSGATLHATGKILGHADPASTNRYAHLATDPMRATITAATDAMLAAVAKAEKEPGKMD